MLVYGILVCNDAIHNEPERTPAHTVEVLMKLSGSFSLAALGAGVLSLAAGPLVAQEDYPSRDIQFVVPFSAGGGSDVVARQIANAINELDLLPVGLIIDNRPGGGGSVGYTYLAAREGDPHYVGTVSIAYFTTPLLGDSPVNHEDFEPIAAIANDPYVMVASNDLGIESLEDVAARDRLVVGSPAAVSDSALLANILGEDLDISMDVIPFDGDGEVLSALLGGHVDIAFSNLSEILPQVVAGEVTAIAVTSADRVEPLPDVPTLQELGHDVRVGNLRGMILPKGVSEEVIAYWEDILQQVANSDYWKENYLDRFSIQAEWMGREEFSKEIVAINDRYEGLMQDLGIIE